MRNIATRFAGLLPSRRQEIVTVQLVPGDGTSVVENSTADQFRVIGDSVAVGDKALIQEGKIIAQAADLDTDTVSV